MSLKQCARDVLDLLERGAYTTESGIDVEIGASHQASVAGTVLVRPNQAVGPTWGSARVSVVDGTTQRVARELATSGPVTLLNFASARNPGGGFLRGAKAQEEDLCRCSGLYPTLLTQPDYYKANRAQTSMLYTGHLIFSPAVVFFRVKGTGALLDEPFTASVITAPAPNSAPYLRRGEGSIEVLRDAFYDRWRSVLAVAHAHRVERLLLGAWGCGAFGGDPVMAASTAQQAIEAGTGSVREIVFAIPGTGKRSAKNLAVFDEILGQ